MLAISSDRGPRRPGGKKGLVFLSDLQIGILESLVDKKSTEQIAEENSLKTRTVDFYVAAIMRLFDCSDASDLISYFCS